VGLLLSINRNETSEEAVETVKLALEYRSQGVVGLDLSGNPRIGKFSTFIPALEYAKQNDLKFTLHYAEVYNPEESKEMLNIKPGRIGHVCFLDDELRELVLSSKIPIEICLTSNFISKSVPSYADHHFKQFFDENYPVTICTDDYGILSTTLSREYGLAALHFNLSHQDLFGMISSSVDQIFAGESTKTWLREKLQQHMDTLAKTTIN